MEAGGRSATILLVDDDETIRRLVRGLLVEEGFNVIDAHDGAEALEVASTYAQPIDLLLTDVIMPKVNGLALAARLLQDRPSLGVIYMSGYVEKSIIQAKHPESIILQKPFASGDLIAAVRQVLASKGRE